jgi:hypothetical protein
MLQFVEEKDKYLGHLSSKGKCRLDPETIEGISGMLPLISFARDQKRTLNISGFN